MKKMILKYPLAFLVILATIVRLPHINGSFWLDEAAQALEVVRPFSQQLDIIADFQPPLLHFLLHFAQYFAIQEWFLRTIGALIPGIITLIYTYKIAERLYSKQTAFMSGLLLATSSFHIFYSQELRPYSLPAAIATLSMYNLVVHLKKEAKDTLFFLTIFNILGLYASYLYPFFMIGQISFLLISKKIQHKKKLFQSFVISIVSFAPFLPIFLQQLAEGGIVRRQLPGWDQVVSITQLKAVPLVFGKFIFGTLPLDFSIPIIILSTTVICFGVAVAIQMVRNSKKLDIMLLTTWLLLPLFSAWLVSFIVPVIQPKRLLYVLPALYVLISYLHTQLTDSLSKKLTYFLFISIISINILGTLAYYINPQLQRENWRALVTQLHQEFTPNETLLVYSFPEEFAPMRWYEQFHEKKFPKFATKTLFVESTPNLSNELKTAVNYKVVLVFDYLRDLTDPNNSIEAILQELGFKEVGVLDYPNIGFIRIYMQTLTVIGMH